ncbi:SMI1/KNR4 family protein [Mucilaginibacter sp. BT774]|uniref:SMI1/KNR4 family protein n=1 Tax=Mucilaginibacter sp. BT774 TaxID=3062276 RepID=UPI00270CD0E2|nr:SMI1/KNR4 family protein [Mucilaginibacter sp. BT774]
MIKLIYECDKLIAEFSKFSRDMLYLGPAINDNRMELFEKEIGFELPFDFKYIMTKHNGLSLDGTEVYGIDKKLRGSSLDEIYNSEHVDADNKMQVGFLPFSPDGYGNHYCLDLLASKEGICPIVFWQHDCNYENNDEVERCNDSFINWVKEVMIEWTLEDYNYDGSEK